MFDLLFFLVVRVADPSVPPVLVDWMTKALGLLMAATFAMSWKVHFDLRALTTVITDPRTGLTVMMDKLTDIVKHQGEVMTSHGVQLATLQAWREAQDEGEG